MAASLHTEAGGTQAQVGVNTDTSPTKNYTSYLENPQTFTSVTQSNSDLDRSKSCHTSHKLPSPDFNGQGMPMSSKSKAQTLAEAIGLNDLSNGEGKDGNVSPNYILAASKHEGLGCGVSGRPCSSWCSPTRSSYDARYVPRSQVSQRPDLPGDTDDGLVHLMQEFRPQKTGRLSSISAIEPDVKESNLPKVLTQVSNERDTDISTYDSHSKGMSGLHSRNSSPEIEEPSKPLFDQTQTPEITHEMDAHLKHESCIGIGSWSRDDVLSEEAQVNTIEDETDLVLSKIYAVFDKNWLENVTQCPNGSRGQRQSQSTATFSKIAAKTSFSTASTNMGKGSRHDNNADEDDSEEDAPKRRPRESHKDSKMDGPRLACPFNRNDAFFFQANKLNGTTFRSCAGPGFKDISRLKAHLYKKHRSPISFVGCGLHFQPEVLDQYLQPETNDFQPRLSPKFITDEIEKKLRKKKKGLSLEEGWNDVYKLIFPNELIARPYYEPSDTFSPSGSELVKNEDHEAFSLRELPEIFHKELHTTFQWQVPDDVKSLLVDKLTECQRLVSSKYYSAQQASGQPAGTDTMTLSTPKASSNGFEPPLDTSFPNLTTFDMPDTRLPAQLSWDEMYGSTSSTHQQPQYYQEGQSSQTGSLDWPLSNWRDSGYSSNSTSGSNCGTYGASCYDPFEMHRNSLDGSSQANHPFDDLRLNLDAHGPNTAPGLLTNEDLISIPRSNCVFNHVNYLPLQ